MDKTCEWILVVIPAASGLIAILVGWWLSAVRESAVRRHSFVERQLREFYSPLLGIKSEIQALGEVGLKVRRADDEVYREGVARRQSDPEALAEFSEKRSPELAKGIQHDNEQLWEVTLPAYTRMVTVFRDGLWLADPATRQHFGTLVEFVELWKRVGDGTLDLEGGRRVGPQETKLQPFYENLEQTHDRLRDKVKRGRA